LLKPHIFCSIFIENIIQFRSENVLWHCTIPIGVHRYRSIVFQKKQKKKEQTPHTKLKNGTPHSNLGAVEWLLAKFPRVLWDQYRRFYLLTMPERWKCASSVNNKTTVWGKFWETKAWCEFRSAWTQLSNDILHTAPSLPHP
jgi:hypothetical protein